MRRENLRALAQKIFKPRTTDSKHGLATGTNLLQSRANALTADRIFESIEDAKSEVFSYTVGCYNRIRLHSTLGCKSLLEVEK